MSFKLISLIAIACAAVQMFVAWRIASNNKEIFRARPASDYGMCISELAKRKPRSALLLRACYGLLVLEWLAVFGAYVIKSGS